MSIYTTEVRYICEFENGLDESKGYNDIETIITTAAPKIFNFDFPIFDESYRLPLEKKILKHFYTREIGFETVGLWKLKLNAKMNEIMPYYNKLYESELIEYNPLYTKNMDRTHTNKYGSQTAGDNLTNFHDDDWNLFSDTPQGGTDGVRTGETLTTAREQTSDRQSKTGYQSMTNTAEDYTENVTGYDLRSPASLINEYRTTFLNIDMQIINDLEELFMQVW